MFATSFQKGDRGVEIFSPSGTDPLKHIALKNEDAIEKVYDRYVKGNILTLDQTSVSSSMSCPRSSSKLLGIIQPWFCLQLNIPSGKSFSLELIVTEQNGRHHRIHFSTNFKGWDANELHARISWPRVHEDLWVTYILNLDELCRTCFRSSFQSLDHFTVFSCCRMRKIFSLPARMTVADIVVPPNLDFPVGVAAEIFLVSLPERQEKASTSTNQNGATKMGANRAKKPVSTADMGIIGTKKALATAPGITSNIPAGKDNKQRPSLTSKPEKPLPGSMETQSVATKNSSASDTTHSRFKNNMEQNSAKNVQQDTLESLLKFNDDDDHRSELESDRNSDVLERHTLSDNEAFHHETHRQNALINSSSTIQRLSFSSDDKDSRQQNPVLSAKGVAGSARHSGFAVRDEEKRSSEDKSTAYNADTTEGNGKIAYRSDTNDLKLSMQNMDIVSRDTRKSPSWSVTSPAQRDTEAEDTEESRKLKRLLELEDRNPWQTTTSPLKSETLARSLPKSPATHATSRPTSSRTNTNSKNVSSFEPFQDDTAVEQEHATQESQWHEQLSASKQALSALLTPLPPLVSVHDDGDYGDQRIHPQHPSVDNKDDNSNIRYNNNSYDNNSNYNNINSSHNSNSSNKMGVMSSADWKQQLLQRKAPVEPVDTKVFTKIQQWQQAIAALSSSETDSTNPLDRSADVDHTNRPETLVPVLCDTLQQLECAFWQSFGREEYEEDIGYFEFDA